MSAPSGAGAEADAVWRAVARDFGWLATSQAALKLLAFVFGVWVVRVLGAAELGRYSAALAFAGLFAVATGPGAQSFGTREMAADAGQVGRLVPDIAALRALLALGVVPVLALCARALGREPAAVAAVALAGLGLPLYAVVATLDSALVARGRVALASACAALRQVLFVALGTLALLRGGRALALLLAADLALAGRALVTARALRRAVPARFERPSPARWPALARRSLPFGLEAMADLVCLHAPLVVLSLVAGDAAAGFFSAGFSLVLAALPFVQGAGTALAPRLSAPGARAHLPRTVGTALRAALLASLPAAAVVALGAGRLVAALFGPAFAPAARALGVLAAALPVMLLWELLRAALLALRLEAAAARTALVSAVVVLLASAALAPRLGATGAALAFLLMRLAGLTQFVARLARALPRREARVALGLARA